MNERIRLLAEQSGVEYQYVDLEKFAKLIVNECADIAYKFDGLTLGQSYTVSKHIKKQFGIEE